MSKPISKRIIITDSKPESFLKVSKALDLVSKALDKHGTPFVLLISNDVVNVRSDAQNSLLQCYYNEIGKSKWAVDHGYSRSDTVTYCKRHIIIDVLKSQSVVESEAGFKALEKVSAISAMSQIGVSEEIRLKYLSTDGWSSILDTEHFKKYLLAIELHFLHLLNYRLESINETKRREAFG